MPRAPAHPGAQPWPPRATQGPPRGHLTQHLIPGPPQPAPPLGLTERRATVASASPYARSPSLLALTRASLRVPSRMRISPRRLRPRLEMGISPAICSNRWGLDEWVIVIAMLLCCCCCCCGCIVTCCLRRRRRRRRREEVQRAATSPSATHHVHSLPDAEPALQLNPHHAHPRRPHPRALHLPGDAAEPRPSRLRKRDQARATAQCGRGGDLYGPREGWQLCDSRPDRSVVHRADPRVIGAPVSPAAAARRPPSSTATGLHLKFACK